MKKSNIQKAKSFAHEIHRSDVRLSGESVAEHTIRVFNKLENSGVTDENLLTASILHHTLDNNKRIYNDLITEFGMGVADLVTAYSKIKDIKIKASTLQKIDNAVIVKTFLNLAENLQAMVIRFADKADNVDTSYVFPKDFREVIAIKALYLYAPICKIMGLYTFVREIENKAFKVLNPEDFYIINKYLTSIKPEVTEFFNEASEFLLDVFNEKDIDAEIKMRVKSEYSIYMKNLRYKKESNTKADDFAKFIDIVAMRILVDTITQCYEVEDTLSLLWSRIDKEREDYIQSPKPNGYKSIHSIHNIDSKFFAEIQIRTHEMHAENEFGLASYMFYKLGRTFKKQLSIDPNSLHSLASTHLSNISTVPIKNYLESDTNIYTFTPKGDIIELPKGSCVLDFAYALHVDIGNGCIGATINGDIAKLTSELHTGDTINIRFQKSKKKPSADWLTYVKTTRARTHIRKGLRS